MNPGIFKKSVGVTVISLLLYCSVLFISPGLKGQNPAGGSLPLQENISRFVSSHCMPCHSSTGGLLSRSKLNFNEWDTYSADKQKKKAALMNKELKKDKMPPKSARENNPAIIPTKEEKKMIKVWADSLDEASD